MKRIQILLPLVMCGLFTASCALLGLKENVKQIEAHGVIGVQVSVPPTTAPTYALALATAKGTNEMIGFQPVTDGGMAVFLLRQDRDYAVGAFTDLNGNQQYDGGEPVDLIRNVRPTPLSDKARSTGLHLRLAATNGLPRGQSFVLPAENPDLGEALPVALGEVIKLEDPRFSAESGEMGLWKPYEFLQRQGMGIYFLEAYQPEKIPVVFVYGMAGSFQDWKPLLGALDRKKYQPWLFYYPSGLALDKSANALATGLTVLQKRHGFPRLCVVAHSMGGLVSCGAIQRLPGVAEGQGTFVTHFVSISSPWGGHAAAAKGAEHLRYPAPSWKDMAVGSPYQKSLVSQPWPKSTRYDLIFSYKSSGGFGLPDENDGVVAVESQLLLPIQERASSMLGLRFDHTGILSSPIVWQRVEKCLASEVLPANAGK